VQCAGASTYCEANQVQGSWLYLPKALIGRHELHLVDLHVNGEHSAKKRVSAIRGELDRLSCRCRCRPSATSRWSIATVSRPPRAF
jgi:hypothetical protein